MVHTRSLSASFIALTIGVALVACSKTPSEEQPVGIPAASTEAPIIAPEQGNGPKAVTLLPLEIGNTWTYRVTGNSVVCTEGEHTRTITKQEEVGGRSAFISSGFCGNDQETTFAAEGSQVLQYSDGEWRTALASSLEEYRTWEYSSELSFHWHKVDWVRVTAGLFSDCWERLPLDNSWSQIYCDGAGMISMSGKGLLVELVSFNLNHGALVSRPHRSIAPG